MFAIVNMMRITGVVISKKSKCAEQTAYFEPECENTVKSRKVYTLCALCRK